MTLAGATRATPVRRGLRPWTPGLLVLGGIALASGIVPAPVVARMAIAATLVFVLPGWSALALWEGGRAAPSALLERLPRAFGLSFTLLTVVTVAITSVSAGSVVATWAYLGLALALAGLQIRRVTPEAAEETPPPAFDWVVLCAIALTCVLLWFTGGIYGTLPDGEEALHMALIRKLHSNAAIHQDNVMYRPGVVSTYLYLPYHLGVAMVARIARVDPLVAYVKLAPLWGAVALASIGALAGALGFGTTRARIVTLVATVLAWNGQAGNWDGPFGRLLPYSHHADFSLGVLLPVALVAVARFVTGRAAGHERMTTPALLAAVTVAHTREGVQIAFYLAAWAGGLALFRDARRPMLRAVALAAALLALGFAYARVHQAAVGHIQEWEDAEKERARELMERFRNDPGLGLTGPPLSFLTDRPNYVQNFNSLFHPFFVVGMLLGPFWALRRRGLGTLVLALPMVATTIVVGIPLVSAAMVLATYSQVLFTPARYVLHLCYLAFGLWIGFSAIAIGRRLVPFVSGGPASLEVDVTSGGRAVGTTARLPSWLTFAEGWPIASAIGVLAGSAMVGSAIVLGKAAGAWPVFALKMLLVAHLALILFFARRRPQLRASAEFVRAEGPWVAALMGLLLPVALWREVNRPDLGIVARILPEAAWRASSRPDVTDFPRWYDRARPLPLPYALLEDLRSRLPEPKVFAADPAWMWMLPALANQYVFAYSQYLSTEEPLVTEFARIHGLPLPTGFPEPRLYGLILLHETQLKKRFPIFNDEDDAETTARFLAFGHVDYLVAPPQPPLALSRALDRWPDAFESAFARDGWTVYRVELSKLPTFGPVR